MLRSVDFFQILQQLGTCLAYGLTTLAALVEMDKLFGLHIAFCHVEIYAQFLLTCFS